MSKIDWDIKMWDRKIQPHWLEPKWNAYQNSTYKEFIPHGDLNCYDELTKEALGYESNELP